MIFNIKITGVTKVAILLGTLLYEDGKMLVSDDAIKVQFAGTAEELMPDSKYWEIEEVK